MTSIAQIDNRTRFHFIDVGIVDSCTTVMEDFNHLLTNATLSRISLRDCDYWSERIAVHDSIFWKIYLVKIGTYSVFFSSRYLREIRELILFSSWSYSFCRSLKREVKPASLALDEVGLLMKRVRVTGFLLNEFEEATCFYFSSVFQFVTTHF